MFIKPCWHCGGEAQLVSDDKNGSHFYFVACVCGAKGLADLGMDVALRFWNYRSVEDGLNLKLMELERVKRENEGLIIERVQLMRDIVLLNGRLHDEKDLIFDMEQKLKDVNKLNYELRVEVDNLHDASMDARIDRYERIKELILSRVEYEDSRVGDLVGSIANAFTRLDQLVGENVELIEENRGLDALFDLQHERVAMADRLYMEAHHVDYYPDLGELIRWLMVEACLVKASEPVRSDRADHERTERSEQGERDRGTIMRDIDDLINLNEQIKNENQLLIAAYKQSLSDDNRHITLINQYTQVTKQLTLINNNLQSELAIALSIAHHSPSHTHQPSPPPPALYWQSPNLT